MVDRVELPDVLDGVVWLVGGEETSGNSFDECSYTPPRHVLVCGHGRGGTTAVSRVLLALGLTTDEPNKFLESMPLKRLNKRGHFEELIDAIGAWEGRHERLFWKDPKIKSVHLIPFLPKLSDDIGFVFVFRDPLNIARRNNDFKGIGVMSGLDLAIRGYQRTINTIQTVKQKKIILISYEKLIVVPELVIGGLAKFLGIDDPQAIQRAIEVVEPNSVEYRQSVAESSEDSDEEKAKRKSKRKRRLADARKAEEA